MRHAVYMPPDALYRNTMHLTAPTEPLEKDVKTLYRWQIKPLHGAIVDFLGKMEIENNRNEPHAPACVLCHQDHQGQ